MSDTTSVKKEMALTRAMFFRHVDRALKTDAFERTEDTVVLQDARGTLTITLGEERTRKLGLMEFPAMWLTLTFEGYSDRARDQALKAFWQAYQRGGG